MKGVTRHKLLLLLLPALTTGARAQSVTPRTCEYWTDGQFDSRTSVPLSGSMETTLDVSALPAGVHALNIRVSDSKGRWSSPYSRFFLRTERLLDGNAPGVYEYWIDNDLSTRVSGNLTDGGAAFDADLSSLSPGLHSFSLRCGDTMGYWSTPVVKFFLRTEQEFSDNTPATYRYWIDDFKGEAKETAVGADGTASLELDLSSLSAGLHTLSMYPTDSRGIAGAPAVKFFAVPEPTLSGNTMTAYEYWFNSGSRTRVACAAANPLVITDLEIGIENVVPNEIPSDYTFDVTTGTVWCDDNVSFGMQAFDALGNASAAVLSETFPMRVPVRPDFTSLSSASMVTEPAPRAGEINAYRVECAAGDSLIWTVSKDCSFDLYDAAGNRLKSTQTTNNEDGVSTYKTLAATTVTYALLHHAPAVFTETAVTCVIGSTTGIGSSATVGGLKVRTAKNTLIVNAPSETMLNVVNVSGQTVISESIAGGEHRYNLPSGVYVARTGNHGNFKVLVP